MLSLPLQLRPEIASTSLGYLEKSSPKQPSAVARRIIFKLQARFVVENRFSVRVRESAESVPIEFDHLVGPRTDHRNVSDFDRWKQRH
jgi:hypothetical protein